ncbi:MAG: TetR/AcrR family transcriptional regulator [Xanthobacteraceae bacterium]
MARRPTRPARPQRATRPSRSSSANGPSTGNNGPSAAPAGEREKIVAALLALLAEEPIEKIGFADIAREAGVSLAALRTAFPSTLAILAAHMKDVDRAVLAEDVGDMEEEPARERLFDVLMRRLEIMAPHRRAVRSLLRSAGRRAPLAFALNALAARSQKWMLAAAGINAAGPRGTLRAQGMAMLFSSVLRTWVRDEDPGLARTMASLDRALARGQRFAGILDDLCFIPSRLCRLRSRWRGRNDDSDEAEAAA